MFCPNCGANNTTDQKFCRSCGLNLEQTALSLLEQKPSGVRAGLTLAEKRLEKLGNIAFGGLGIVGLMAVIGMIYTIVVKFILSGSSIISGIIFILLLIFAVLGIAYVIFNESLKEKKLAAKNPHIEPSIESVDTGKLLDENQFEPVPSVTEDTTKLLRVRIKTKDLD